MKHAKMEMDLDALAGSSARFGACSKIYAFTTENIAGYFPCLNFAGKNVLTVTGSGDQIINSYLFGAESVAAFDINTLPAFFAELKMSALQLLPFNEFKQFFLRQDDAGAALNMQALDFRLYEKVRHLLAGASADFFDNAYALHGNNGHALREYGLFNNLHDTNDLKLASNPYLHSEEQYLRVREAIGGKRTQLINCPAETLASKLEKGINFDIILLSNIADYAGEMFPNAGNKLEAFSDAVVMPLTACLAPEGIICAAYVYDAGVEPGRQYRSEIDVPEIRKQVFNASGMDYTEIKLNSVIHGKEDAVILLQNKRRKTK